WHIEMADNSKIILPAASPELSRTLYFYAGSGIRVANRSFSEPMAFDVCSDKEIVLECLGNFAHLLLLQGKPIAQPVVQSGPFVMNSRQEILQTIAEFKKTQFGAWPWPRADMVHGFSTKRFALHANGVREEPR
ncbi:MAG: pirin family protein, partial [Bdellovibrionales bacterium]|nr:pirin family protein [Bdellovibrionales bacterium]